MFKLLIALALFVAIQGGLPGGFTDRPELVESPETVTMVNLSLGELEKSQNLRALPVKVLHVSTQVVNGINYRIVFTARPYTSTNVLICKAKVYQSFNGAQSVSSVECD